MTFWVNDKLVAHILVTTNCLSTCHGAQQEHSLQMQPAASRSRSRLFFSHCFEAARPATERPGRLQAHPTCSSRTLDKAIEPGRFVSFSARLMSTPANSRPE